MKILPLALLLMTGCVVVQTGEVKPIAPGLENPEGNVRAVPGQTYYNRATGSLWIKSVGDGSRGWTQL